MPEAEATGAAERGTRGIASLAAWWRGLDPVEAQALRRAAWTMAVVAALEAAVAAGVVAAIVAREQGPARTGVVAVIPSRSPAYVAQDSLPARPPAEAREPAPEGRDPTPSEPERAIAPADHPPSGPALLAPVSVAVEPAPAARVPEAEARAPAPVERTPAVAPNEGPLSGRALFARQWLPHDPHCHGGDGLGPVYNETSCLACHGQGAPGGGGPKDKNVEILSVISGTITGIGPFSSTVMLMRAPALKVQNLASPPSATMDTLIAPDRNSDMAPDGLVLAAGGFRLSGRSFRIQSVPNRNELVATSEEGAIRGQSFSVRPDDLSLMKILPGLGQATSAVFHRFGVDPQYKEWRSALKKRIPVNSLLDLGGAGLGHSQRNPPPLFGAGMIDALPDAVFVAQVAREPAETRGRVSVMKDGRIGRFGWKAQIATLEEFVLSACANELGLEVPGHHQPPSPFKPFAVAKSLDLTPRDCDALVSYVSDLPAPIRLDPSSRSGSRAVENGRRLFEYVGCASCHAPNLGPIRGIYSDLLLHDTGLTDAAVYYGTDDGTSDSPGSSEWRTPPLWGVRDSAPYLHDGRAATLAQAVLMHHGQAAPSAQAFAKLPEGEKKQIFAFLDSLSAPVEPDEVNRRQAAEPDLGAGQEQPRPGVLVNAAGVPVRTPRVSPRRRAVAAQTARQRHLREDPEETQAEDQSRPDTVKPAHLAAKLHSAQALEKMGKIAGALDFYRTLVREAPGTAEAREAAERIKALSP
jgi:hypothetical protein